MTTLCIDTLICIVFSALHLTFLDPCFLTRVDGEVKSILLAFLLKNEIFFRIFYTGFNSGGMMLGGGAGRELAKWILHGKPDIDIFAWDVRYFNVYSDYNSTP